MGRSRETKENIRWFQEIIDTFASEYGWSKEEIMQIYIAEVFELMLAIADRWKKKQTERIKEMAIATRIARIDKAADFQKALEELEPKTISGNTIDRETLKNEVSKMKSFLKGNV